MMLSHERLVSSPPGFYVSLVLLLSSCILITATSASSETSPQPCDTKISTTLPLLQVYENGSAWDPEGKVLYPEGTYWKVDGGDTFRGCPCKLDRPCLPKCCAIDQAMNATSGKCVPYDAPIPWFRPNVTDDDGKGTRATDVEVHYVLFHGGECDGEKTLLDPRRHPVDEFFVRTSDGHLSMPMVNESNVGPEGYCLEYFPESDDYQAYLCSVAPKPQVCGEPIQQSKCLQIIYILYPIGMCISIVFLAISFFVYAFIPELRNLHGKCLLCHMASLMTAYIFLTMIQSMGCFISDEACIASGFVIYFSFLSTFLWLNIMCIDMCIAFSGIRAMTGSAQERDRKKFLLYMLYAWGVPLIPLCASLVMEFAAVPDHLLKPQFRQECWFQTNMSRVAYFIGPVAVILTVNIGLFLFTAIKIFKLKKQTAMLKKGDSRRHHENEDNKQRFNLYLKLFIVMGVNWMLEIISWVAGGSECIWIPADLFNTLQGLFIFLIFVWKDKIRRKLTKRLCPRLAAKLKMHGKKGSSSSDGRSICTVSSTLVDGDNMKLSTVVTTSPSAAKNT